MTFAGRNFTDRRKQITIRLFSRIDILIALTIAGHTIRFPDSLGGWLRRRVRNRIENPTRARWRLNLSNERNEGVGAQ